MAGKDKKGQASVEFLVLLAIAVFVLLVAVIISREQISGVTMLKEQSDARNALLELSSAAKEVYAQGEGAKKQVYVVLPTSYDAQASSIGNTSMRLNVRDTDHVSTHDFEVRGSFPQSSGAHWVWVISEGNQVRIGSAMLSLSKNSIYLIMASNSSAQTSFSVTNIWDNAINVSSSSQWTIGDVNMTVTPSGDFSLNPDEGQPIDLTFTASEDAVGFYNGKLSFTATDGAANETVKLPMTVEVVVFRAVEEQPLTVAPDFWGENMQPAENANQSFSVCTNRFTDVTGVTFTPSIGPPASWVGNLTALGPIGKESCEQKTLNISVPNGTAPGTYSGSIQLIGQGVTDAEDTIALYIVVGETGEEPPPLTVTPDFWGEDMEPAQNSSKSFSICTNNFTSVTGVTFTPSGGPPGMWIGNTTALGAIGPASCENKTLTIGLPNSTLPGIYEGSVQVTGSGAPDAEDTIALYIVVEAEGACSLENQSACNCPVGSGYWGVPTCNCQPATIYVLNGTIHGGPDDGLPFNGTLRSDAGNDILVGTNESDIILTGTGNDRVCGEEGDDIIYGDNSNDIIDGGPGDDTIYAGAGGDWIYGKAGNDIIYGEQGVDEIDGGSGADTIYGGDGDDLVYGGPGNDELDGGDGKDTMCGNDGADTLIGDDGNDELDGGTGTDTLDGGVQNDDCYRGEVVTCENELPGELWMCGPS